MSSIINFFICFRVDRSDDKVQSDRIIRSNLVRDLKYFKYFWIIKCIGMILFKSSFILDSTYKVYTNKYIGWSKPEEGWVKLNVDIHSKGMNQSANWEASYMM